MPLAADHFPYEATSAFPPLFLDYVKGEKKLEEFYSHRPDIPGFRKAIAELSGHSFKRELLYGVLKDQYAGAGITEPASLQLVNSSTTFTVCTGHQLCLFTGPLYFIYKVISVINLAQRLKKEFPQYEFVPVYWMASEDHDVEEVDHIHLFGKTLKWNTAQTGPVGDFSLDSLREMLDELRRIMGESGPSKQLDELFQKAYSAKTLAAATRQLVHHLFGMYGLVVVDGNDARLKREFIPFFEDDLQKRSNFSLVNETISELERAGYEAQVRPREINIFTLEKNARIRIDSNQMPAGILQKLKESPEQFSPNVVLRPLYQQKILPNIAYVGGPAEISYWLEYRRMFGHHQVFFPVLVPRASVMWLEARTLETLEKLKLARHDMFRDTEQLVKEFTLKHSGAELTLQAEADELKRVYELLGIKLAQSDATLKASVEAELQKALNGMKNLESKLIRAEKQRQEGSLNQLRKLKAKLFPEGMLQERYDNFIPYYIRYGEAFFQVLLREADPLHLRFTVIAEQ